LTLFFEMFLWTSRCGRQVLYIYHNLFAPEIPPRSLSCRHLTGSLGFRTCPLNWLMSCFVWTAACQRVPENKREHETCITWWLWSVFLNMKSKSPLLLAFWAGMPARIVIVRISIRGRPWPPLQNDTEPCKWKTQPLVSGWVYFFNNIPHTPEDCSLRATQYT